MPAHSRPPNPFFVVWTFSTGGSIPDIHLAVPPTHEFENYCYDWITMDKLICDRKGDSFLKSQQGWLA
jgi:hypothetical protein